MQDARGSFTLVKWKCLLPDQWTGLSQPSVTSGLQRWMRALQTVTQQILPPHPHGDCWGAGDTRSCHQPLLRVNSRQDGPRQLRFTWKGKIQWAQRLVSSHQRMRNFFTWYLIYDVQTSCSLCCKLIYSLTPPSASLEQFSQRYWDVVSWAQSSEYFHQINSLLSGCGYMFSVNTLNIPQTLTTKIATYWKRHRSWDMHTIYNPSYKLEEKMGDNYSQQEWISKPL